jgi:hypothetical protein
MSLGAIALSSEALRRATSPADGPTRADLGDLKIALLETENTLAKRLAEQEKLIRILKNVIADERNREPAVPAGDENYVPSQYRERNAA